MTIRKDFITKLAFYIVIGIIGVIVDMVVSNVFYNLILFPTAGDLVIYSPFNNDKEAIYLSKTIAALIGGIAGLINNFVLNEFFVYRLGGSKKHILIRFFKYSITIVFGSFIIGKFIILNICSSYLHLGFSTSNLIAIAIGTLINYPINYFWSWGSFSVSDNVKKVVKRKK